MKPLVSVIVPIYNVEKYLKKCVDSVIAQTYENIEIILVDDGSPDNCGAICDEYGKKDKRVRIIHKQNGGLSDARNVGIDTCRGKYISFVDSDDFVSPFFLEILYNAIKQNDADISSLTRVVKFTDYSEYKVHFVENASDFKIKFVSVYEALKLMMYLKASNGAQLNLYKRELFDNLRFPVGYLYEDLATTYKALIKSKKIALVDADIYAYRIRSDSILRRTFNKDKMSIIEVTRSLYKDICEYDISLKKPVASRSFAANYNVFLQVPKEDKNSMRKLWDEVIKYRKIAMTDMNPNVRLKNRVGILVSYFGMNNAWRLGRKITHK